MITIADINEALNGGFTMVTDDGVAVTHGHMADTLLDDYYVEEFENPANKIVYITDVGHGVSITGTSDIILHDNDYYPKLFLEAPHGVEGMSEFTMLSTASARDFALTSDNGHKALRYECPLTSVIWNQVITPSHILHEDDDISRLSSDELTTLMQECKYYGTMDTASFQEFHEEAEEARAVKSEVSDSAYNEKERVTKSEMKSRFGNSLVKGSYSDLRRLFPDHLADYYSDGTYGWACDYWALGGGICLCMGSSPVGIELPKELMREFSQKAYTIEDDPAIKWEDRDGLMAELREEFTDAVKAWLGE